MTPRTIVKSEPVAGELLSAGVAGVGMRGRPAETLTGAGALGSVLAIVLGVHDPQQIACMVAGLGLVPAGVTLYVDSGGLRGVLRKLWRGRT